ncbi:MAG TPA: hypothetical protein VFG33_32370, partial [Kribbella sp.]|uniref:hypothetical protein n=1 Tax=Kribbella sp. TaxID=1871183 RepID=UPI002D798C70
AGVLGAGEPGVLGAGVPGVVGSGLGGWVEGVTLFSCPAVGGGSDSLPQPLNSSRPATTTPAAAYLMLNHLPLSMVGVRHQHAAGEQIGPELVRPG